MNSEKASRKRVSFHWPQRVCAEAVGTALPASSKSSDQALWESNLAGGNVAIALARKQRCHRSGH